MIRIIHMIGSLDIGGSQMLVMNLYRTINRKNVQFDFIIDHDTKNPILEQQLKMMGANVFRMPTFKGYNVSEIRKSWNDFFRMHPEYKVLHTHVRSYATLFIPIAHKYGVKTIIHSHSTSNGGGIKSIIKNLLQVPLRFQADYFFACSKESGEWLFGKHIIKGPNYRTIKNGIILEAFQYEDEKRKEIRDKIGIEQDQIAVCHVGRFHEAKNHMFLLDVFAQLYRLNKKVRLILVGDGDLHDDIEQKINDLGLEKVVYVLGNSSDVPNILLGSDCFLFPSKWEGLPVSVIEAQAAGLPCFVSDTVTKEVSISKLVKYLSLNSEPKEWAEIILSSDLSKRNVHSDIQKAGFDITMEAKWLENFYRDLWKGYIL